MKPTFFTLILFLLIACSGPKEVEFDVLIVNGQVADGSGQDLFKADVGIKDGVIVSMGKLADRSATNTIDATNYIVSPGFIDVHGHIERSVLERPEATNLVRDGVTSMVTGNCGGSRPILSEFWQEIESNGVSLNVASLIGHNTVRREIMGNENREPTAEELEAMKAMVATAMEDGAVGLSTGLLYLPGMYAKTDEIIELAKVIAPYQGIYASHIRYQDHRVFESIAETVEIGRQAEVPVQVSHIKIKGKNSWGRSSEMLEDLNGYREEGIAVTIDQYPYTAASTGLSVSLPRWVQAGGRDSLTARLKDEAIRGRVKLDMLQMLAAELGFEDYSYAVVSNCRWNPDYNGKSIPEVAIMEGRTNALDDQLETILEMMEHGERIQMIYHFMGEEDVRTLMQSPLTMIASDGGIQEFGQGNPHPRSYGTNARVLGRYVREMGLLTLEEAIHKMTALPAKTFNLLDRGKIEEGMVADVVVFDPGRVNDEATFENPHAYSVGIDYVLVNGQLVIARGKHTGSKPGQVLKTNAAAL